MGGCVMDDRGALQLQLMEELGSFGIECSEEQATLLVEHLCLVIEKNKKFNLTRIVDPSEAITLHVVDSLLVTRVVELEAGCCFLDLGTGAGFPGIPLSIVTGARGVLLDSVGKKVDAVAEFCAQLGLEELSAAHARVEDFARDHLAEFDVVCARAVAQTNVLVEYGSPLLKRGGKLVVMKGTPSDEELAAAGRAADLCGLSLVSRETFELPGELGHREILVYEKTKKAKIPLPRQAGLAKRQPLGLE